MPYAPLKPCSTPQCPARVARRNASKCAACLKEHGREDRARRGSSTARGYDRVWRKKARQYLAEHPVCECELEACYEPSVEVDHIIPFAGIDDPLRLDDDNLQALAKACHSKKTATYDGGFGHRRRPNPGAGPNV